MSRYQLSRPYEKAILDKLHESQVNILKDFIQVCKKYNLRYFGVYGTALGAVRHKGFIPWDDDTDVAMLRTDYNKFLEIAEKELGTFYRVMTPLKDARYACTVTHLQRKNTRFVPEFSRNAQYDMCIDLDIFPLDYVANHEKEQIRQGKRTNFFGKLLYLSGNKYPVIPMGGIQAKILEIICIWVHYVLKLFRITPQKIYRWYLKEATAYEEEQGEYVTSFEYSGSVKDKVKVKDLFPTKEVPFEDIMISLPQNNEEFLTKVYGDFMKIPPKDKQINHAPYLIQFEGEPPIKLNN